MGLKLRENELLLKQQIEVIRELGKMRLVSLESVQLTRSMHAAAVALGPWNDLYVWGSRWEGGMRTIHTVIDTGAHHKGISIGTS